MCCAVFHFIIKNTRQCSIYHNLILYRFISKLYSKILYCHKCSLCLVAYNVKVGQNNFLLTVTQFKLFRICFKNMVWTMD